LRNCHASKQQRGNDLVADRSAAAVRPQRARRGPSLRRPHLGESGRLAPLVLAQGGSLVRGLKMLVPSDKQVSPAAVVERNDLAGQSC
jgi:hypothetical protein